MKFKLIRISAIIMAFMPIYYIKAAEQKPWYEALLADIKFVNKTGHDLDIETIYRSAKKVPKTVLAKEKNTIEKALSLTNQNLDDIKEYRLNYSHGQRYYTAGTLAIETSSLSQAMAQKQQHEAIITINPKLGPVTGYVYGFGEAKVSIRPSATKKPAQFELEESFISFEEPQEKSVIFATLGLSHDAPSYEVFGLGKYPKADPSKSFNEQRKEVFDYLKQLEEKRALLIKQWADNAVRDVAMFKKYGINNFSERVRKLIDAAYFDILKGMGAK